MKKEISPCDNCIYNSGIYSRCGATGKHVYFEQVRKCSKQEKINPDRTKSLPDDQREILGDDADYFDAIGYEGTFGDK